MKSDFSTNSSSEQSKLSFLDSRTSRAGGRFQEPDLTGSEQLRWESPAKIPVVDRRSKPMVSGSPRTTGAQTGRPDEGPEHTSHSESSCVDLPFDVILCILGPKLHFL